MSAEAVLVVVDNRDSFTFNLVQAVMSLGEEVRVMRAREHSANEILALGADRILIGPGPGSPQTATASLDLVRAPDAPPILGVCLGHQALGVAFGARVERAPHLIHGRTVPVEHDGRGVFTGVPSPARFTRYNSLTVCEAALPDELEVSARSTDGDVMGLRHRSRPIEGVQFHPESILSEHGLQLLENFVSGAAVGVR